MIKAILESFYSKRDTFGNCYWALRWTDTKTGRTVEGTVTGGESNISNVIREMGLEWGVVHYTLTEMGIRDFNSMTKRWNHAGCTPSELTAYIRENLKKK